MWNCGTEGTENKAPKGMENQGGGYWTCLLTCFQDKQSLTLIHNTSKILFQNDEHVEENISRK